MTQKAPLNPREITILQAVVNGQPYKGIACQMDVNTRTVYMIMHRIRRKLKAHSTYQAVAYAVTRGLVTVD